MLLAVPCQGKENIYIWPSVHIILFIPKETGTELHKRYILDAMVISDDWAEEELERQLRALSPIHCIEDAEKKLKELESNENLKNGK